MTRKQLLAVSISALVLTVATLSPLVYAEQGSDRNRTTAEIKTETETEHGVAAETEVETEHGVETRTEKIEAKRTEIRARLDDLKEKRESKLDDKRLAVCEKKVDKINAVIQKRSAQATKHLAVFKKISDRVQNFVTDKNLTIENYDQLVANIADKEQSATAAIEANTNTVFDCASADGSGPGKVAKASVQTVRDALKDYRAAIKELIVKVKANAATKEDSSTTETQSTGEGQ